MIELKNDTLCFSFPKVMEELENLAKEYFQQVLPSILAEDRDAALNEVLRSDYRFRRATEKQQESLRRLVHELSDERIKDAFDSAVREAAKFNSHSSFWSKFRSKAPGEMAINFQRTFRIPDDHNDYHLPPGLGSFPVRHLDDFEDRAPSSWLERGGVLMPMYQSEALWLNFNASYPFAVKIASGKINAITGEDWRSGLNRQPQDYLVLPQQPWLDGFAVAKGIIRQFVAMPLGGGYSVEEQITGKAEFGGIQIQVYPMKAAVCFQREILHRLPKKLEELLPDLLPEPKDEEEGNVRYSRMSCLDMDIPSISDNTSPNRRSILPMGLGAGGRMKQEIYEDRNDPEVWDLNDTSRCFIHLCNALVWREITGTNPPHPPVTAEEYERHGLPWFDFYRDDVPALQGSKILAGVKTVATMSKEKGDQAVLGNDSVKTGIPIQFGPKKRPTQGELWKKD